MMMRQRDMIRNPRISGFRFDDHHQQLLLQADITLIISYPINLNNNYLLW